MVKRIRIEGQYSWSVVGKSVLLAIMNAVGFFGGAPVITTLNPNNNRCEAI
tara:strand:+ start:412 stop:564 length:153 start_codon:yes stop_codon:yes gene_type:complete